MMLLLTGRAEAVVDYENIQIRSVNFSFKLPKILRLFKRHKCSRNVKFSRTNVFQRDNFTCQYCEKKFRTEDLTIDHIIPLSKGGGTNWKNVVASCASCNTKKGAKSLKEAGLKLLTKPVKPRWSAKMYLRLNDNDPDDWKQWFPPFKVSS